VGFEPIIPAFKRAETVHALDSTATAIGSNVVTCPNYQPKSRILIIFRHNIPRFNANCLLAETGGEKVAYNTAWAAEDLANSIYGISASVTVSLEYSCPINRVVPTCTSFDLLTPWPLVRKRTILTERPPLVGEVSANFCG
jgi:hypothetical protein